MTSTGGDSPFDRITEMSPEIMAGPTRLELVTSGVTGRRSIQLNYDPAERVRNIVPESGNVKTFGQLSTAQFFLLDDEFSPFDEFFVSIYIVFCVLTEFLILKHI